MLAAASAIRRRMKKTANKKVDKHVPAPTKSALRILGESSKPDVLGSYTGIPENKDERPVQDADDL